MDAGLFFMSMIAAFALGFYLWMKTKWGKKWLDGMR